MTESSGADAHTTELEAQLAAIADVCAGCAVSDFLLSFAVVRRVAELRAERKTLKALSMVEAQSEEIGQFVIIVTCDDEQQQTVLLERWLNEGLRCKATLA